MRMADKWDSYAGQAWDEFSLDHIRTSSVRITVMEVYTSGNNGCNELKFYTGISELPSIYYDKSMRKYHSWTKQNL